MFSDTRIRSIIVVGGGLAGLSLVWHLLDHGFAGSIVIVDPRKTYGDDRTWCFWDVEDHPFRDLVTHSWPVWRIRTRDRSVRATAQYPYVRLPARILYARMLDRLGRAGNVTFRRDRPQGHVTATQVPVQGETLGADIVFDGRPPDVSLPLSGDHSGFMQQFAGRRIRTTDPFDDREAVTLMDFNVDQTAGLSFLYVLPLGPREALVEATVFARQAVSGRHFDALLTAETTKRFGPNHEVAGSEGGMIPMLPALSSERGKDAPVPIGTRAGAPRPSTGYAFLPIQRHSRTLARQITSMREPSARMRDATTVWLDRVFLGRLLHQPDEAPNDFARMFSRVAGGRMVRFLTENASWPDRLHVMGALPTLPYLREAAATVRPWS